MKSTTDTNDGLKDSNPLHTTSPQKASRYIAYVSAASAVVCGAFLAVFADAPSDGFMPLVLWVTAHHIGQTVTSYISFKVGGAFAFFALAALSVDVLLILISSIAHFENLSRLAVLITPATCSLCAIVVYRRHSEPQ